MERESVLKAFRQGIAILKRVYLALNLQEASMIKDLLEMEGIASEIRGTNLTNLQGSIPSPDSTPSLWVSDSDYEKAIEIIRLLPSEKIGDSLSWVCPSCKEDNEDQFGMCWNCGYVQPE